MFAALFRSVRHAANRATADRNLVIGWMPTIFGIQPDRFKGLFEGLDQQDQNQLVRDVSLCVRLQSQNPALHPDNADLMVIRNVETIQGWQRRLLELDRFRALSES